MIENIISCDQFNIWSEAAKKQATIASLHTKEEAIIIIQGKQLQDVLE